MSVCPASGRLSVHALERRDCPALSLIYAGGTLRLAGAPEGELQVNFEANTSDFRVLDVTGSSTTDLGVYRITKDLRIQMPYRLGAVDINFTNAAGLSGRLPGNVEINLGNGYVGSMMNDSSEFPIEIRDELGTGEVAGNVRVNGGSGREVVYVGQYYDAAATTLNVNYAVRVGGSVYLRLKDGGSSGVIGQNNDLFVLGEGSSIQGNLISAGVDAVTLGVANVTNLAKVAGNVIVNNTKGGGSLPGLEVIGVVGGDVVYTGSSADDGFTLTLTDNVPSNIGGTILGNVTVLLGDAQSGNDLFLDSGTVIGGNVTVISGANYQPGFNFFTFFGEIFGNVSLIMGNGDNVVDFKAGINGPAYVGGSFHITGGNLAEDIGGPNSLGFKGTIDGDLTLNLGNGDNTFTFNGVLNGSRLTYTGGSGNDSLTITGQHAFFLSAALGAGADTFAYGTAATTVGKVLVDFGVDFDTDVYDDLGGTVLVTWPQTLLNLP